MKLPLSADPVTKESYDGIIVVTDRFTKFGRFIPYRETWIATDLVHVFIVKLGPSRSRSLYLVLGRH